MLTRISVKHRDFNWYIGEGEKQTYSCSSSQPCACKPSLLWHYNTGTQLALLSFHEAKVFDARAGFGCDLE